MENMFCFQCEQTIKGSACTSMGFCGKNAIVANEQDVLTCEIIALASLLQEQNHDCRSCVDIICDSLFATVTNVNFDEEKIKDLIFIVREKRVLLDSRLSSVARDLDHSLFSSLYPLSRYDLFHGDANIVSLRSTLLFGLRGMAAYMHHARVLQQRDAEVEKWLIKGVAALAQDNSIDAWLNLLMEFGKINIQCLALLDAANTGTYGDPTPVSVTMKVEKGPFIVVTGHDLHDLKLLLEQSEGKGVNIYTHSEMLPAHGYPELKKYTHLKGHFGTAWQNQQKEFAELPAPILFTTNCLMPVKESYHDKVYTTSLVAYPEMKHIDSDEQGYKDFSGLIAHAIRLGGYKEDTQFYGINGGGTLTTGFGRKTVLDAAPAIIDNVKSGNIKHFFLVGGCDGAKVGRNYYTEFVKQTPKDTLILTLACGKFRINDLDIGTIGSLPRIIDMGQCNDAYGAIQVASALAQAFECGVNDLPLTLVLSWYEQKAVCILLSLLSLGIKNIYVGPSIPAFFSQDVLNVLVEKFELRPITSVEEDLKRITGM